MANNNSTVTTDSIKEIKWSTLLQEATTKPGLLHQCYSTFHNYSLGNLFLAALQLQTRGMEFGPIATFENWKKQGRYVKKGEKAISLWMPIFCNIKEKDEDGNEVKTGEKRKVFVVKNNWFALCQTEGKEYQPESTGGWNIHAALRELDVKLVAFDMELGALLPNMQGYAKERTIAISPVAQKPLATQFHELAHVVLGHTAKGEAILDGAELSRDIKEMEAEATAMLCMDALGHADMAEYSRGYIQHWAKGQTISETSAKRIFAAADKILKAGSVETEIRNIDGNTYEVDTDRNEVIRQVA